MKKSRLFGKIIYYLFTFVLGIILAVMLPSFLMYFEVSLDKMAEYLDTGEYAEAMSLVGGYYNSEPVLEQKFDSGGGIVLFEATTLVYNSGEEDDQTVDESKLHNSYAGFVYGVGDTYQALSTGLNLTVLSVTPVEGSAKSFDLLDYDADGNGSKDGISTLTQKGFIYLDFDADTFSSIAKLTFLDKDGNVFQEIDGLSLGYNGQFFTDVAAFVAEYNRDYNSEALTKLSEEFLSKNESYSMSSHGDLQKIADKKAMITVVIYFVSIYIIGDFLLGNFYIIKFFRWFIYDVCKVKPKRKQKLSKKEIFGNDYYSSVTVSLDLEAVPDFNESVQIKYTNTDAEVVFILIKENNYTATERIKAGTYVNPFIDVNREYTTTNLPDNLEVEGYKMDIKIKIIKREV